MAFAFFRRRQKMVIFIMVILMVSFLVGIQGLGMVFNKTQDKTDIGRLGDGSKIMMSDLREAESDIRILLESGIDVRLNSLLTPNRGLLQSILDLNRGADVLLAYVLLVRESVPSGPVTEGDVDSLLASTGKEGQEYRQFISNLRSRNITEQRFRQAVARLIRIHWASLEAEITTPPSQTELEHLCFQVQDRVRARYLRLPAEQFIAAGPLVDDPEQLNAMLDEQFEEFKDRLPGSYTDDNPYGFGYRIPDRVAVEFMLARGDLLLRVVRPSEQSVRSYFDAHKSDFTKEVPTGETDDQGEPIMRREPESFGEARSKIIEIRRPRVVEERMFAILQRAAQLGQEHSQQASAEEQGPFEHAAKKMELSADTLLDTVLAEVTIDRELPADAMALLAERANIQGICYPFTDSAGQPLPEDARVTVKAENITLREALDQISRQLGQPAFNWKLCDSLTGPDAILFSVAPISTFPIVVGRTDLVDQATLAQHPLLGMASQLSVEGALRPALVLQAFDSSLFDQEALSYRPLELRRFPLLIVPGGTDMPSGLLAWRVTQAMPARNPEGRTPEIDERMIADLKLVAAMKLTEQEAEEIKARALKGSLGKVAEDDVLELKSIEELVRKRLVAVSRTSVAWMWSGVEGLRLPSEHAREEFVKAVFALVEEDEDSNYRLAVVPVRSDSSVCVVELLDHIPAVLDQASMLQMKKLLEDMRSSAGDDIWYSYESIRDRCDFKEKKQQ